MFSARTAVTDNRCRHPTETIKLFTKTFKWRRKFTPIETQIKAGILIHTHTHAAHSSLIIIVDPSCNDSLPNIYSRGFSFPSASEFQELDLWNNKIVRNNRTFIFVLWKLGAAFMFDHWIGSAHFDQRLPTTIAQTRKKSETNLEKAYYLVRNWTEAECETCGYRFSLKPFVHRYVMMFDDRCLASFIQINISELGFFFFFFVFYLSSDKKRRRKKIITGTDLNGHAKALSSRNC